MDTDKEYTSGSPQAGHLCVLVHGLWGNPNHMRSIAQALRNEFSEDKLYLLIAARNSGNFTYDGFECGGERVCHEIEEQLEVIRSKGGKITKLSIVGYSMGGLIARYAVGLLYMKGVFNDIEPMNFTTFASPHLGVRAPLRGVLDHLWNVLGAKMLSQSGKQFFTVDNFRDTGRPLLAVMADPESVFMRGLKMFKRKTLYSNIINDRSAVYYTTSMSRTDPYVDMDKVRVNYLKGWDDVILDPKNPVSPHVTKPTPISLSTLKTKGYFYIKNIPFVLAIGLFLPLGLVLFVVNAVVQTFRSSHRIQLHEKGLAGIPVDSFRGDIIIKNIQGAMEDVYENVNNSQSQDYLGSEDDEELDEKDSEIMALERYKSHPQFRTLALTPNQFFMIAEMDKIGWRKYRVHIHNDRHTHAAIIHRWSKPSFSEGLVALRHWSSTEFLI